jgi:hypothetical protein
MKIRDISAFTNEALVKAALAILEPLYRDENALEPERVSEKLHQNTFRLERVRMDFIVGCGDATVFLHDQLYGVRDGRIIGRGKLP